MKILFAMTYFRPYVSGPIIYVENLAREMVKRGHEVSILTSQYEPGLVREEWHDGVRIVRVPVLSRVSKGVIMPTLPIEAAREIQGHDVLAIQVPQGDVLVLAALAWLLKVPATMTYHCDVQLPKGLFNRIVDRVLLITNFLSAILVNNIVAYTQDYAQHSPLMSRFLSKVEVIPPPVEMPVPPEHVLEAFRTRYDLHDKKVVGICARFATEKGFEHLIGAIPYLLEEFPTLRVLHAGEFENVIGEQEYRDRMRPMLEKYHEQWISLGVLGGDDLAAFFAACDVTVLPSLNRTESFGFVQIESMLNGTPVVASNLPGVRVPVETTGMGFVVPIGNTKALASAIGVTLRRPHEYLIPRQEVESHFSVTRTADGYLALYERLIREGVIIPYQALLLLEEYPCGASRLAILFGLITFFVALFFPWRRGE